MKLKKTLVGVALAAGAVAAPFAGKANTETNAAPKAVELSKAEKATKLKEAIHLGLPREELLKYVDFPEWIPVTPDGKYDSNKASDMWFAAGLDLTINQKAFINYMTAVEKGANPDIEFQKFAKQITGGDQEKMDAINKIKDTLQETQNRTDKEDMKEGLGVGWLGIGALVCTLFMAVSDKFRDKGADTLAKFSIVVGAVIASTTGMLSVTGGSLYQSYQKVSEQLYNAYANQEIQKAANPKIVQMDMSQAKQFIEWAKQNGPVK